MRTFLLILVLCVSGMAQQLVGTNKGKAYFVMDAVKKGELVSFIGVISAYYDDKFAIDKNNHLLTAFSANCRTYEYVSRAYLHVIDGKTSEGVYKAELKQAVKPQLIFSAIQVACGNTDKDYY